METRGHVRFLNDQADFVWDQPIDKNQDYLVPKGGPAVYTNRKAITDILVDRLMQALDRVQSDGGRRHSAAGRLQSRLSERCRLHPRRDV